MTNNVPSTMPTITSDQLIEQLAPYGLLRLHQSQNGWSASCDLFVRGMTAEVRSDFKHPTPLSALIQLREKVRDVASGLVTYAKQLESRVST